MQQSRGFTLIELMVAVIIFAIISVVSYRIISSLVMTKQVTTAAQEKWGNLSLTMSNLGGNLDRLMPLLGRDQDGAILPAVLGKPKLNGVYDSQLELTLSGYVGDPILGSSPPKRVGYRFYGGSLYLVSWPFLNRALTTQPEINLLVDNVKTFQVFYLYLDRQWHDTWPPSGADPAVLPKAIKLEFSLMSGESLERAWSL